MCFICSLFVFYYFDRNFSLFYFDFRRIEHNIPMLENNRNFPEFRKYLLKISARYCEEQSQIEAFVPNVSKKRSLVIWKARDCTTTSGAKTRLKIVKLLHWHGLKIAGNSSCLNKNKNVKHKTENYIDFFDNISPFKFYLAFENSHHCNEYITEKLWYNSFYVGVVPVVWGGAKQDYLRLAPPKSFIHYEDFKTPQALIHYLNYLDKNDTAYMEYFEWRKQFPCSYPLYKQNDAEEYEQGLRSKHSQFLNAYCTLCKMLRDGLHFNNTRTVSSLKGYWEKEERSECFSTRLQR